MIISTIEAVEDACGHLFFMLSNDSWELISRDLFTGLHDKNKTEIYEHDLLATSNDNPEYDQWDKEDNGLTEVMWRDETASFTCTDWMYDTDNESIYSLNRFVEVVGTSHQTPTGIAR